MKLQKALGLDCKVSIIVAAHNVGKYIRKCVTSILNQTYSNIEIICIDDWSTDNTREVLEEIKLNNPQLTLICNETNLGVSEVRNEGVRAASGEWICFVDGDDYIASNMVKLLLDGTNNGDADIVIGNYYSVDRGKCKFEAFYSNSDVCHAADDLQVDAIIGIKGLSTSVGVPWGKIYRRELLLKNNICFVRGLKRMQDLVFNLYSFQLASKISMISAPIYYYRIHNESAIHAYDDSFLQTAEDIVAEIKRFSDNYSKNWSEVLVIKEIQLIIETVKLTCIHPECEMSFCEKIEFIRTVNNKLLKQDGIKKGIVGRNAKEKFVCFLLKNNLYILFYFLCILKMRMAVNIKS